MIVVGWGYPIFCCFFFFRGKFLEKEEEEEKESCSVDFKRNLFFRRI